MKARKFAKLLKYIQKIERQIDRQSEKMITKKDIDELRNSVDAYAKKVEYQA